MAKTKKIYTVVWSSSRDTDEITRFSSAKDAERFAEGKRHYSEHASYFVEDVPVHIAHRWGF